MKKIVILSMLAIIITTGCKIEKEKSLTIEEAKTVAIDFINNNLMQPGNEVSVKEVVEEDDLYKVVVNMPNGQEIDSYISKDGKKFFPQVMDIEETKKEKANKPAEQAAAAAQTAASIPKQEKAKVDLFVMSYCPFGTQIEKGIIPVIEKLGDKVDFNLRFVDYAMHGEKELDENLRQYCIQKEASDKIVPYLRCFLGTNSGEASEGDACMKEVKVSKSKIDACVKKADQEFKVKELYSDKSTWSGGRYPQFNTDKEDGTKYGVQGSPTLVINDTKISSGRDAQTLMNNICAGYENPPAECSEEMSSASPSSGFGWGGSTGGADAASCGS